jgi:hypothetical protein
MTTSELLTLRIACAHGFFPSPLGSSSFGFCRLCGLLETNPVHATKNIKRQLRDKTSQLAEVSNRWHMK